MYGVAPSFLIGLPGLNVPFQSWVALRSRSYAVGSVAVREYNSSILYGTTGGGGFVRCFVGVSWDVWSHAMSVIVVERVKRLGATRRTLNGYLKRLVGQTL